MKKRCIALIAILLVLSLCFALTACTEKKSGTESGTETQTEQENDPTQTEENSSDPVKDQTKDPSQEENSDQVSDGTTDNEKISVTVFVSTEDLRVGWKGNEEKPFIEYAVSPNKVLEMIPESAVNDKTEADVTFASATVTPKNGNYCFVNVKEAKPVTFTGDGKDVFYVKNASEQAIKDLKVYASFNANSKDNETMMTLRVALFQYDETKDAFLLKGVLAYSNTENVAFGPIEEDAFASTLLKTNSVSSISLNGLAAGEQSEFKILFWIDGEADNAQGNRDSVTVSISFDFIREDN